MEKRILSIDEYINEQRMNEAVEDISDWDFTDDKYVKWAKKLKVKDKFKMTFDGVDAYQIPINKFKKGQTLNAETAWIGHDYSGADSDICEVVAINVPVNIEDFGDGATECFIFKLSNDKKNYYAFPMEWA